MTKLDFPGTPIAPESVINHLSRPFSTANQQHQPLQHHSTQAAHSQPTSSGDEPMEATSSNGIGRREGRDETEMAKTEPAGMGEDSISGDGIKQEQQQRAQSTEDNVREFAVENIFEKKKLKLKLITFPN